MWIVVFAVIFVISVIALVILSQVLWEYDFSEWLIPLSIGIMVISLITGLVLLGVRASAKQGCLAFEETKSMFISSVANADDFENIGVTNAIIEQNKWLVHAKTSVRKYGIWSLYYSLGVEEMEYISLGGS
jgi:hypothetical protein